MISAADRAYADLLRFAEMDPRILAFWLDGSRGKGWATEYSDYDCTLIVAEDAFEVVGAELGVKDAAILGWRGVGIDLNLMTLPMFETHAAWGSAGAWERYNFTHLTALVDKTGRIQPMIDVKGRVPPDAVAPFIHASLDHFLNQLYRGLKCLRDGDPAASRLEAAEGIAPFLDALFALHGGRLRPYYKYLAWELETRPLYLAPWSAAETMQRVMAVLGPDSATALQRLLVETETIFRSGGYGGAFDGWGATTAWMARWRPVEPPGSAMT